MEVKIDKSFQKDTDRIHDKAILKKIVETINTVQNVNNIRQIRNFKKLKGSQNNYRIRIKDYRIGVTVSGSTIEFIRCLHRKDIYKFFPK